MSDELLAQRIERGRELLKTVRHAAMATVNDDGSPHNSPYFFMRDDTLEHLYWGSHPESQHSVNVARAGEIFVVLYEATVGGGLYIRANKAHATEGEELDEALAVHNAHRAKFGKEPLTREYYEGGSPQRMYKATVDALWVNISIRGEDGHIIKEHRQEISQKDLLGDEV